MNNIEAIWEEYHQLLHAYILKQVRNPVLADDLYQEAFLKINRHLHSVKSPGSMKSWLYRVTSNVITDHFRRCKEEVELPEHDLLPEKKEAISPDQELVTCLKPMLEALPDKYRKILMLSELEGISLKEISEREKMSLSCVKSRVQRGRKKLREMMIACCEFEFDKQGGVIDYEQRFTKDGKPIYNCFSS